MYSSWKAVDSVHALFFVMHKHDKEYCDHRANMTVHLLTLAFVVGKHVCFFYCTWKPRCVCRFSHAVWSCLERWRSRGTSPFINRTRECILWNLSGVMTRFSHRMTQYGENRIERESRETVSMLSDLREPMADKIFPRRWVPAEEVSQQTQVRSMI